MKRGLLSAVAFGVMTTAAAAEPTRLTDAKMRDITAGLADLSIGPVNVNPSIGSTGFNFNVANNTAISTAIAAFASNAQSAAANVADLSNTANLTSQFANTALGQ